jgi:microcystin-dependent protein
MDEHRNIDRSVKRVLVWAGLVTAGMVGGGALVFAAVPHSFTAGETLTAANLNGNFTALDQRVSTLEALLPAGTMVAFGGLAPTSPDGGAPSIPAGWLLCDGSAISRTTYATLFATIGINFGGGDGINTFNLPDLRGRFLRGWDNGAGHDPDATARTASNTGGPSGDVVGSLQADDFKSHNHQQQGTNRLDVANGGGIHADDVDNSTFAAIYTANTGGKETRPKNVAVAYIIKY